MNLKELSPILSMVFQGIGLISIILLYLQIRYLNKWNKLNQTVNSKWTEQIDIKFKELTVLENNKYFDLYSNVLNDEQLIKIKGNRDAERIIKDFLNVLEEISCAYFLGALNKQVAYVNFSNTIRKYYSFFNNFINYIRERDSEPLAYIELQKLFYLWDKKYNNEIEKEKKELKKKEVKFISNKGTKKEI